MVTSSPGLSGRDLTVTASMGSRLICWCFTFSVPARGAGICHRLGSSPLVMLWRQSRIGFAACNEVHQARQLPRELAWSRASGPLVRIGDHDDLLSRDDYESRLALALFLGLNIVGLTVARRVIWHVLKYPARSRLNYGRAVIVGTGAPLNWSPERSPTTPGPAWNVGLSTIHPRRNGPHSPVGTDQRAGIAGRPTSDRPRVRGVAVFALGEVPRVCRALSDVLVEVQLVPDVPNLPDAARHVEIDGMAFLSLRQNPISDGPAWRNAAWTWCSARCCQCLSPLMVALAGRQTFSPADLHRQSRTGLGPTFRCSVPQHAGRRQQTGPVWAT